LSFFILEPEEESKDEVAEPTEAIDEDQQSQPDQWQEISEEQEEHEKVQQETHYEDGGRKGKNNS
jgi:hypothetical protein